ncbi:MAG: type II secretion system F family protein [Syntrophales bacterium]|jgi:tight adherence protein B|nr:type II secretion system F family protein [Syntrophales bacterium]MDY0043611.1 type II secretion system F family protein [Syntrophales bacterium]
MIKFVIAAGIFVTAAFVIEMFVYAYDILRNPDRSLIRKRLRLLAADHAGDIPDIEAKRVLSDVPALNRFLPHIPGIRSLELLLRQAKADYSPGFFILFVAVLFMVGLLAGNFLLKQDFYALLLGLAMGAFPVISVIRRKKRRMAQFTEQLPEALDLIARALRAGHSFTSGLKLAADEFKDPLGPEFQETLDEINYGAGVSDALRDLAARVDCGELKYFTISVILQRETGGNLAEIIENIASLIRERFKLKGKIRTLTAEGRLSAFILVGLPFFLVVAIRLLNPDYVNLLFTEPSGKAMVVAALILLVVGIFIIRRIVNKNVY